jgi:hypothetical protein
MLDHGRRCSPWGVAHDPLLPEGLFAADGHCCTPTHTPTLFLSSSLFLSVSLRFDARTGAPQAAAHVGTRDVRQFTSHAQNHFIKLCLQGRPLPAKVLESGDGYTLSGKPLDPTSGAGARWIKGCMDASVHYVSADAAEWEELQRARELGGGDDDDAEAGEGDGGGAAAEARRRGVGPLGRMHVPKRARTKDAHHPLQG